MKKSKKNRTKRTGMSWGLFLFVLVLLYSVSSGMSFLYLKDKFAFQSDFIAEIEARQEQAESQGKKRGASRLYGAGKEKTDADQSKDLRKDALLVAAEDIIRNFVKPYKVRLLDLYMDNAGTIYIDFGDEIKRNFNVDAMEELKMLAGLYKGIKNTVPGFRSLKILVNGRETESLGGHINTIKPIGAEIAAQI